MTISDALLSLFDQFPASEVLFWVNPKDINGEGMPNDVMVVVTGMGQNGQPVAFSFPVNRKLLLEDNGEAFASRCVRVRRQMSSVKTTPKPHTPLKAWKNVAT